MNSVSQLGTESAQNLNRKPCSQEKRGYLRQLTRQHNKVRELIFEETESSVSFYAQINHHVASGPAVTSVICCRIYTFH